MKNKIIVALDVSDFQQAEGLVKALSSEISVFKIGMELFTRQGPRVVEMVHAHKAKVFLDLKFHDIPNTVFGAVKSALELGVFMCNVHALGGREMMCKALEAKQQARSQALLVAVTVLTSMNSDMLREVGVEVSLPQEVERLALLTKQAGLSGVVCSGHELLKIQEVCGKDFVTVVPGIRPSWVEAHDQKRVLTPREAFQMGAHYIVIGRPITHASSPLEAAKRIIQEL